LTYSKKTKQIRVSIVLPVYNEADHIAACLHAIARQTVRPYEVLVVDNNSADATAAIAASFPFVRIIREARQGVVYARNTGFNAARGDVIGRIDADTVIADNWVATLQTIFIQKGVDAIGGKVSYYDMARADVLNMIDLYCRRRLARLLDPEIALQGANMALRRSAWQKVRGATCSIGGLHEDFDLSIHLARARLRVGFDERLHASIGFRQAECNWREFTNYALLSPRTYARHGLKSQRHMYPIVLLGIIFYGPLWVLHHGYDRERGKFRLRLLTATAMRRVNPATFVD
jgi:glycosyltransferase involved in cell wall biosynthesis